LRALLRRTVERLPHHTYGRNRLLEYTRNRQGRYAGMVAHPLAVREGGVARAYLERAGRPLDTLLDRWFALLENRDEASRAMMVDVLSYLPGDIMTKVDRMSMAASIEVRAPLLDHHMVEFAAGLSSTLKMRTGIGKWILREAVRGRVPDLVFAKRKQGFGIPLEPWLRGPLRHHVDNLLVAGAHLHEWAEPDAIARVVSEHVSSRRDHSPLIWKLIVLQLWLENGGRARPCAADPAVSASWQQVGPSSDGRIPGVR
jgi:asparagine synthetase B (glutamine-hydrolysing)